MSSVPPSVVSQVLEDAALEGVCETQEGDCESVAVALHHVFDVDAFVLVYEPAERRRATHAAVEIDGVLFDGDGQTSREALLDRLAMFRPRDFEHVDSQEEMLDWFEEKCLVTLDPNPSSLAASPTVVRQCVTVLERALGNHLS